MRDDLETRVKQLEDILLEVQNENAKLRDLIMSQNQKWDYAWFRINAVEAVKFGELGWELAASVSHGGEIFLFFKRRMKA